MNKLDIEKGIRPAHSHNDLPDEALRDLFDRWQDHAATELPHPGKFDAVDFPTHARYWTWLETIDDGDDFVLRFVGPEIINFLMGVEVTGMRLTEYGAIVGEEAAQLIWNLTCAAHRDRRPIVIGPLRPPVENRSWMKVAILALPCASDGITVDRILMANYFETH